MRNKIVIIAGIIVVVLLFAVVIFGGGSSTNNVADETTLEANFDKIVCEVKDEDDIEYNLELFTNDIAFDYEIKDKVYTKAKLKARSNFESLGIVFRVTCNDDLSLNIKLYKNDAELKTSNISIAKGGIGNVDLHLENAINFSKNDELIIEFNQTTVTSFKFDTMILFLNNKE